MPARYEAVMSFINRTRVMPAAKGTFGAGIVVRAQGST
jgi:hypothetical protein